MPDLQDAAKIAGEWTKQLALWATGTLVLSLNFLKDFLKGQQVIGGWWWCLVAAWFMLICSIIFGHLAFGAPLTGAGKHPAWSLTINTQTRWLSGFQLVFFVLGLGGIAVFAAFHVSASQGSVTNFSWKPIGCVGPFVPGSGSQLENHGTVSNTGPCSELAVLSALIHNSCKVTSECLVVLVGSTDKRPLSAKTLAELGSNEGLARARSEWVREQLVEALRLESNRFLVLTVGPSQHGVALIDEQMRVDRTVKVYVLSNTESAPKD